MTYFAAWIVLGVCSHILFMDRMNKIAAKWGGILPYMRIAIENKDSEFKLQLNSEHFICAMILLMNLVFPPFLLGIVVKSYFVDGEKELNKILQDGF